MPSSTGSPPTTSCCSAPRLCAGRDQRGQRAARRFRLRAARPAAWRRRGGTVALLRRAAATAARAGPPAAPAHGHEVELALHGAPAWLPRLRRHQDLRGRRPGERRAPCDRPARVHRLQRQPASDPAAAAQGRGGLRARRPAARRPRRQGAAATPARALSARRAVPDRHRRAPCPRHGHPAPRRAPAHAPLRVRVEPLRALRLLPDLRAARALQHRPARAHAGGVDRRLQGQCRRVRRAVLGFGARAHPDHGAHARGQDPRLRRTRDRAASDPCGAALGGRVAAGARRAVRRGAWSRADAALRRGLPGGLPRGLLRAHGGVRHRADGGARRRRGARAQPLRAARGARGPARPARPYHAGHPDAAVAEPADAREDGREGDGRAPLRDRAPGRQRGVAARLRPAARRRRET